VDLFELVLMSLDLFSGIPKRRDVAEGEGAPATGGPCVGIQRDFTVKRAASRIQQ